MRKKVEEDSILDKINRLSEDNIRIANNIYISIIYLFIFFIVEGFSIYSLFSSFPISLNSAKEIFNLLYWSISCATFAGLSIYHTAWDVFDILTIKKNNAEIKKLKSMNCEDNELSKSIEIVNAREYNSKQNLTFTPSDTPTYNVYKPKELVLKPKKKI